VVVLLVVVVGTIGSSLVNRDIVTKTPLGVSDVGCSQLEPLWLMAQSVPSASLVPCVELMPVGWSAAGVAVNNGRSVITLDHDRAGTAAVLVELTASCDLARAVEVTSEQPGARRYLRIDRNAPGFSATRFYVFQGGCIAERFAAAAASGQQLITETSSAIGFTTREQLRQALSQRSDGRLQLDPGEAR